MKAKCTLSHLLNMQVWNVMRWQTTGLLIIKTPVELSCQCVPFLWRKRKKNDLEMSHLYFKILSQYVATATKVLAIWEKTDVFASIKMQSLEKEKGKKQ